MNTILFITQAQTRVLDRDAARTAGPNRVPHHSSPVTGVEVGVEQVQGSGATGVQCTTRFTSGAVVERAIAEINVSILR